MIITTAGRTVSIAALTMAEAGVIDGAMMTMITDLAGMAGGAMMIITDLAGIVGGAIMTGMTTTALVILSSLITARGGRATSTAKSEGVRHPLISR